MRPKRESLDIKMILDLAEQYCKKNNLSVAKLKSQKVMAIGGNVIFAQPSSERKANILTRGLAADKETRPTPTLVLKKGVNGYAIEETPHTRVFLR